MKYITYISNWYVPKNGLEKAITSYLRTQDRQIVMPEDFDRFKDMVAEKINELNAANKRCTPVKCGWRDNTSRIKDLPSYNDWRITLNGHDSICIFNVYAVPAEFKLQDASAPTGYKDLGMLTGKGSDLARLLDQQPAAAPNQLNLLDEIAVSKKTMAIGLNTEAMEIIEVYAPDLHPAVKEQMAKTIDRVIDNKVEYGQVRKFNEGLERTLEGRTIEFDIPRAIISDIENIAKYATVEKRARLMQLTRADINALKKKMDRNLINELRDLLNQNLVDRYENAPICLPFFLGSIDEKQYTKEKLLRLLSQGEVSPPRIEAMIDAIQKEYKVLDLKDELEAQGS